MKVNTSSSFSPFENPRQGKDLFRLQINQLCFSLENGDSLETLLRQMNELSKQALHLHNPTIDQLLDRLRHLLPSLTHTPTLLQLESCQEIFRQLDQETTF